MKVQTQTIQAPSNTGGNKPFSLEISVISDLPTANPSLRISRPDFISIFIYDTIRNTLIKSSNIVPNSTFVSMLSLGSYNITVILNLQGALKTANITSALETPIFMNLPIRYSNITLFLDSNESIIIDMRYITMKPKIANIYDNDGNGILEYDKGEYMVLTANITSIQDLLNSNYSPLYAIVFLNGYASGLVDYHFIYLINKEIDFFINSYPIYKTSIDINDLSSILLTLLMIKTEINGTKT